MKQITRNHSKQRLISGLLFILTFIYCSSSYALNWQFADNVAGGDIYYDADTIKVEHARSTIRTYWELTNFSTPRDIKGLGAFRSTIDKREIDCALKRSRFTYTSAYVGEFGVGKRIISAESESEWSRINKGSSLEKQANLICSHSGFK